MKDSIYATLEINEPVIIFDKKGKFVDEGLITQLNVQKEATHMRSADIYVNGNKYHMWNGYNIPYRIFNKERYELALHQNLAKELTDVVKCYASYSSKALSHEQCAEVLTKVRELRAILKPMSDVHSKNMGMEPDTFQKAWGNTAVTEDEINEEFVSELCFHSTFQGKAFDALLKRNPPDNLVSIHDGKTIDNDKLAESKS